MEERATYDSDGVLRTPTQRAQRYTHDSKGIPLTQEQLLEQKKFGRILTTFWVGAFIGAPAVVCSVGSTLSGPPITSIEDGMGRFVTGVGAGLIVGVLGMAIGKTLVEEDGLPTP